MINSKLKIVPETPVSIYDDSRCKMSLCSFSVAGIVTWNDNVLTEILLRLPAKTLTRFKLVCKHWLSLISDHQFCRLHTLHHPKLQPSLILQTRTSQFFYLHPVANSPNLIPYSFSVPNPKILSSCNGLLLLQSDDPEKDYYVYNPTTKQSRKISLTNSDKYTNVLGLNLAFDPSKSPHYKIVCVRAARDSPSYRERSCQIEVYDSQSCIWKLCLEPFTASIRADFTSGAHWNNVIHWKNHPSTHLYFDIDKNVIRNLPEAAIPWPRGGSICLCQLQESNGRLYYFIIMSPPHDKSVLLYELKGDYSQWLLKHNHGFGRLLRGFVY